MKRFYLQRNTDASGVSGVGNVAEGCQFDTGWCALVWLTGKAAMSYYPDIETLEGIHGHHGMTNVVWVDDESSNVTINREQAGGPKANRSIVAKAGKVLDGRRRREIPGMSRGIDRKLQNTGAMYCEHANECPQACPCPDGCYCKDHACKGQ